MQEHLDIIIENGTVIDGTGAPRYQADIGIAGNRIAEIGDLKASTASLRVDAKGLVVSPGFIDAHAHDDRMLLSDAEMRPKLSQGVTTVITGNCGISLAPMTKRFDGNVTAPLDLLDRRGDWFQFGTFGAYLDAIQASGTAINFAPLVGHTTLRIATMEDPSLAATHDQIARMRDMVDEAMESGAIGVSTGLAYTTALAATTQEVIDICEPLQRHGGIYCTHMRDESDGSMESLRETFEIGQALAIPVVVSHHKLIGERNFGRSIETLAYIAERMRHQPICLDCYPYDAGSSILEEWRAKRCERVLITWSEPYPDFAGMDLRDIAARLDLQREEAVRRLMPAGAIYFVMDEGDVERIMSFATTMIGSDGLPHDDRPHPRL
ncbi:amidohydrolase family protein [Cupriavidus sp.]|uniref:N-acyl-D-amino-acid deacylase family protein n=1 Tax=unclassified Cupriavidus TaxID=2640874 RepID=UPI00342E3C2E